MDKEVIIHNCGECLFSGLKGKNKEQLICYHSTYSKEKNIKKEEKSMNVVICKNNDIPNNCPVNGYKEPIEFKFTFGDKIAQTLICKGQ